MWGYAVVINQKNTKEDLICLLLDNKSSGDVLRDLAADLNFLLHVFASKKNECIKISDIKLP